MSTTTRKRNGSGQVKLYAPQKLDLACGQRKKEGFKGIDLAGDADIVWNLNEVPWPIKTSSVKEAYCSHYVEHIPHWQPGWTEDGWWRFFGELYRVMRNGAVAEIIHPYAMHGRAFWDPTHVRYINEITWYYLDREWRQRELIDHYASDCDFEIVTVEAVGLADEFMSRNMELQTFARTHYWNVIPDLRVLLKARK